MQGDHANTDPASWDPALDAVTAAPDNHRVIFENDRLRVLEVTLLPDDEEPVHHHRWPSVFVLDELHGPVHDISPEGAQLPPRPEILQAVEAWDKTSCLVINMPPQPAGRVVNASGRPVHGIRIEMKG